MDTENLVKCYYCNTDKDKSYFPSKDLRTRKKCNGCINKDISDADREYPKKCIVRNGVSNRAVNSEKKKVTKANLNSTIKRLNA